MAHKWHFSETIEAITYTCGYCGRSVGSDNGYTRNDSIAHLYICPVCDKPSFFNYDGEQVPGVVFGNEVEALPTELGKLYREIRTSTAVGAYTASVLSCRKLLMHVAVANGAEENKSFVSYVDYLATHGFIPPNARVWVDHIRSKGCQAPKP